MALTWLRKIAYRFGYDLTFRRLPQFDIDKRELRVPRDMPPEFAEVYRDTAQYTMTSVERMYALYGAVQHVIENNVSGCLVECGVWKGGSTMLMAETLLQLDVRDRDIWLYDTFAGMTEPSDLDIRAADRSPTHPRWEVFQREDHNEWAYAPLDEVRANMARTGYPEKRLHYVVGAVEDTLPAQAPREGIALLRLDTDWYQSTYHEMTHLYPLLAPGGILVIDDYGSFEGCKLAIDEYFDSQGDRPFIHRIDSTGRLVVKMPPVDRGRARGKRQRVTAQS